MSNWGEGYRQGHKDGLEKAMKVIDVVERIIEQAVAESIESKNIEDPAKDFDGGPSQYAVANKCCGGVDAHDVGCGR